MSTTAPPFDQSKADSFADQLIGALNRASMCLMTSIGHRTGLFDRLKGQEPMTSEEIATHAGLHERYVREWLGAMVTSGVIEYEPSEATYRLPDEHAAFLCRSAGANNIGAFTQYISVLGSVEDDIVKCFHEGGGVPYERFHRFHEVMAEDSGQSVLSSLETHVLPLVPDLRDRLEHGIRVLDLGCGSGRIVNRLAELFPRSQFLGIDLSEEAIATAREDSAAKGLTNTRFVVADLSDYDEKAVPEGFDLITTFDAIHDQARPLNVLKGIYRALKPDGVYVMQDISGTGHLEQDVNHPIGTFLYTISCMHCMTVSLAQGGEGLGAMWGEVKTRDYLRQAGFEHVQTNKLAHDIQNNWYVIRKS